VTQRAETVESEPILSDELKFINNETLYLITLWV